MPIPDLIKPASLDELRDTVAGALAGRTPLAVIGNGTKAGLGRPVQAEATLGTERLAGVDLYEPEELVMSAGAGTPLAVIEAMLDERGQELAFEPPDYGAVLGGSAGRQTIGGVFATNLGGPRRVKAGAARDHLLGVQCVTGRGEAIKTGGRVVKNVTGYDLCKLLAGSHGTLAVMSRVTFKVLPKAETSTSLLVFGAGCDGLLARLRRAMGSSYDISGAAMLPAEAAARSAVEAVRLPAEAVAALRLEGPGPSVAYRLANLETLLEGEGVRYGQLDDEASKVLWREIRDVALLPGQRPLWRLSIPPRAGEELGAALKALAEERIYDWAGGLVWLVPADDPLDAGRELRRLMAPLGGHATLVRAPDETRAAAEIFQPQPGPLAALTRRVKASFDPEGILNPGRMYAGI
jgi:glycolate oxidase FAD binding subunit